MRCERCAGLVVAEHFSAGSTSTGCWAYGEWRCINCGATGLSEPAVAHPAIRNIAGNHKVGGQRRAPHTISRR
jgi:hypothetical protein